MSIAMGGCIWCGQPVAENRGGCLACHDAYARVAKPCDAADILRLRIDDLLRENETLRARPGPIEVASRTTAPALEDLGPHPCQHTRRELKMVPARTATICLDCSFELPAV